ncbi:MAG: RNA polymerase sigma factor [Bacteroidota bacterium]
MSEYTEAHIVQGCLSGDQRSQRALYERYKVQMFRLCLRYAHNRMEAEDMLQEGFVKVYTDLHQFKQTGPLGGWIRRVMVNTALQFIRKRKKLFPMLDIELAEAQYALEEERGATLNPHLLTKMIQRLPAGYRAVFNMHVLEGYTHREIAEYMGIEPNTSKSQLSKAKAMLRKLLSKQLKLR